MSLIVVIVTALSGLIATVFWAAAKFIELKVTEREDDLLMGRLFYKIAGKSFDSLQHKSKVGMDLLAKFIYGLIWSIPIPILFFQMQPRSFSALFGLVVIYLIVFLILDSLIHYAFKIGTPAWELWGLHPKRVLLNILYSIIYCTAGVFAFIGLAYTYVVIFLINQ